MFKDLAHGYYFIRHYKHLLSPKCANTRYAMNVNADWSVQLAVFEPCRSSQNTLTKNKPSDDLVTQKN